LYLILNNNKSDIKLCKYFIVYLMKKDLIIWLKFQKIFWKFRLEKGRLLIKDKITINKRFLILLPKFNIFLELNFNSILTLFNLKPEKIEIAFERKMF
jgi:hypothetical protein